MNLKTGLNKILEFYHNNYLYVFNKVSNNSIYIYKLISSNLI